MGKSVMSEQLKQEIANELGVYNIVKEEGWDRFLRAIVAIWLKKPLRLQTEFINNRVQKTEKKFSIFI